MNQVFTHKLLTIQNTHCFFVKKMVTSEVVPSIGKHGAYITKEQATELFGLTDKNEAEALRKVNNPRGETRFCYDVLSYSKRNYPHVLITPGLGENQITHFGGLGSKAKGYRKGQPDLKLKCENGDRTGIITIDLTKSSWV